MAAANTDKFQKVGVAGTLTSLSAPGHSISGTTITVGSTTNWPTDTAVTFAIRQVDSSGDLVAGTYTEWRGVVSGSTLTGMVLVYGSDQVYPAGSTTQVYIPVSAHAHNRMVDAILQEHDQDGTHGAITASSITATTGTFDTVVVSGTATSEGWTPLGDVPDTITANGNRNYDLVFNGVDHTSTLSPGMKLQLSRTVAAPDQCADLEASSSQYFSRTGASVNGMTFTDDFTVSAWIKLESYTSGQTIVSRWDGSSGFYMTVSANGQIDLVGTNGAAANYSFVRSYASVPLNKWVHVAAQLDMSAFTATTTTSYVMFDGLDVSASVVRSGTNPTTIAQAGNLQIGAVNGTGFFDGKIAQVAIYSDKVPQATIRASMNQALSGSETSLISAYSLDNSLNDLNANANNLTANGGAAATATDSPFANAVTAGLLEYAEINSVTFSTNTTVNVRVPDTCMIPTSGGVSAVSYSTQSNPYGLPYFSKIIGQTIYKTSQASIGTSITQVTGQTVSVVIPPSATVRVSVGGDGNNAPIAAAWYLNICVGTVSAANQIGFAQMYMSQAGTNNTLYAHAFYRNTSTSSNLSVTFNLGAYTNSGTITYTSSNHPPLTVELV